MKSTLAHIFRHPLKAIGREALDCVTLETGGWMPWDRVWAVAHAGAKIDGDGWAFKTNFLRGVTEPALMAATTSLNEETGTLTLQHSTGGELTIQPDKEEDWPKLAEWLAPLWPAEQHAPTGIHRAADAHLTDVPDPWLSIHNTSTHRAVEQKAGTPLSIHRWRGNLWIDGLAPWQEFEWVGKTIQIGSITLEVEQPITRCKATMANPETGKRDVDTLATLRTWDHQDFGVYARVVEGGTISVGDTVAVPA